MKKFVLCLMLAFVGIVSSFAQVVDNGTAKDNWYVGGGVGTQLWNSTSGWHVCTPITKQHFDATAFGGKYFTPYIGFEASATGMINTASGSNFIDGHLISLGGVVNMSNLIWGYKGERRFVEIEAIAGPGWYHAYSVGKDFNHSALRIASRVNLKLAKNFNVFITPEYVSLWSINDHFQMNPSGFNIYGGFKWNIPSKRGGFKVCKLYDADEVSKLNEEISRLRNLPPTEIVVEKPIYNKIANSYVVLFPKGSSAVDDISSIASDLKKTNSKITITGGISPEGPENLNKNLAYARALAVRQALVYAGISIDRITITNDYSNQRCATIITD